MKIDLMGNYVPNDAEIEATMQLEINDAYAPAKREKIIRTGVGKDLLDAYFVDKGVEKAAVVADRNLLAETLRYEAAEARLAVPALDPNATDEEGNLLYPLDENGVNATIEKDLDERADSQVVVESASFEVLSLSAKRKGE